MTPEQREILNTFVAKIEGTHIGEAVAAALADLDAALAALRPVARALREPYQIASGRDLRTACLTLAETNAVLAAAGEETS